MTFFRMQFWDYVGLCLVTLATSIPGLYQIYRASMDAKSTRDFLVSGEGRIGTLPIAVSMAATILGGAQFLGAPGDTYRHGIVMFGYALGGVLAVPIITYQFLPVFFNSSGVSVFEYIEKRYSHGVRLVFSAIIISQMLFLGSLTPYVISTVFSYVSDLDIWYSIASISIVCIAYTSFGGFKAVVWTDMLQMMVMVIVLLAIIIRGYIDQRGFTRVWKLNQEGNRTQINLGLDQNNNSGLTIWSVFFGGLFLTATEFTSQYQIQRSWAAGSVALARRSMHLGILISTGYKCLLVVLGMIVYAKFHDCDPFSSEKTKARDQEVVLLVVQLFGSIPGLFGVFFAAFCCSGISSFSSVMNSAVCLITNDFVKPFYSTRLSDSQLLMVSKLIGVVCGCISVMLILVIQNIPGFVSMLFVIKGVFAGPILGMFTLGMLSPWTSSGAALIGCLVAILFIGWASVGRVLARLVLTTLPLSTSGCNITESLYFLNTTINATLQANHTFISQDNLKPRDVFPLYTYHPYWYPCWSTIITITVGLIATVLYQPRNRTIADTNLLFPCVVNLIGRMPLSLKKCIRLENVHTISRNFAHHYSKPEQKSEDI